MISEFERGGNILLDHEHGKARGVQLPKRLAQRLDDRRGEPQRQLVNEQQLGQTHETAGDGAHLLLAA